MLVAWRTCRQQVSFWSSFFMIAVFFCFLARSLPLPPLHIYFLNNSFSYCLSSLLAILIWKLVAGWLSEIHQPLITSRLMLRSERITYLRALKHNAGFLKTRPWPKLCLVCGCVSVCPVSVSAPLPGMEKCDLWNRTQSSTTLVLHPGGLTIKINK